MYASSLLDNGLEVGAIQLAGVNVAIVGAGTPYFQVSVFLVKSLRICIIVYIGAVGSYDARLFIESR